MTKSLLAILLLLPITSIAESEAQKYALNDCIMNINPDHSWYKQEALVMDIVDSQLPNDGVRSLFPPPKT